MPWNDNNWKMPIPPHPRTDRVHFYLTSEIFNADQLEISDVYHNRADNEIFYNDSRFLDSLLLFTKISKWPQERVSLDSCKMRDLRSGLNSQKKILLGKHTFTDDTENVKSVMRVDKSQAPGLNPRRRASRNSVNSVFSAPYSSHPNICDETLRRAYSDDPSNIIKCEMAIRRQSLRTSSLRRGFWLLKPARNAWIIKTYKKPGLRRTYKKTENSNHEDITRGDKFRAWHIIKTVVYFVILIDIHCI